MQCAELFLFHSFQGTGAPPGLAHYFSRAPRNELTPVILILVDIWKGLLMFLVKHAIVN